MSNFAFLAEEFPEVFALAREPERLGLGSPGAAAIYARIMLTALTIKTASVGTALTLLLTTTSTIT